MAANLTPQYHQAEARYRAAQTPEEELAALEEMWRELPKHKSSEKIQAELKKKLSAARKALHQPQKRTTSRTDPFAIAKCGAGQIVLLGTANVGKSSIVAALTHAHVTVAGYPFATALPVPGMVHFEDVQLQLVDTPPVTAEHVPTGFPGLWRSADALVIVADLASEALLEDVDACRQHLATRSIELVDGPRALPAEPGGMLKVPGVLLANKSDVPGAGDRLAILRELLGIGIRIEPISTRDPSSVARLPELLFRLIRVVRVYAKPPGRKPDLDEPFVLPTGSNVHDLARRVYRGFEHRVYAARLWGAGAVDGQNIQLEHVLADRDVVELHS